MSPHIAHASAPSVEEVSRRLQRFEQTKDPGALWPGLTEPARVAAAREIERVTRLVLAGETTASLDPDATHDPYAIAIAGYTSGMSPVLARWAEDGIVHARAPVLRRIADHLSHSRIRAARIEREVLPALDALIDQGLRPVVLKGFHTAHVYFDEPGVRRMADVDVLVAPEVVGAAESALESAGFRPDTAALKPYKRDWIARDVDPRIFSLEVADERSKWVLELHASLDRHYHPGAVAALDGERSHIEFLELAGRSLHVLSQPLLLVTLACHCSQELDGSRLLRLVEIVRVIRTDRASGRLHWDDVLAMLERTGTLRFAYPAFALAEDLAPGSVDPRVLSLGRRESTWAARHTVDRLVPAGGSLDDRGALRQLMWTRGPVAILQRALRNVWPASFVRPRDVVPGWRVRLRRLRAGVLSFRAPDERRPPNTPVMPHDRTAPEPDSREGRK